MENTVIRKLTPDDFDAFISHRMDFFRELESGEVTPELKQGILRTLKKLWEEGNLLGTVAERDGDIISMAVVCLYETLPNPSRLSGKTGYIQNVYTVPAYRGKGLAVDVLTDLIEDVRQRGVEMLYLSAEVKAVPLYERLGFETVEREMRLRLSK
ncbi:MAG: GNAT family N-acetyltransferase [Oscillospiraceae bacterium]